MWSQRNSMHSQLWKLWKYKKAYIEAVSDLKTWGNWMLIAWQLEIRDAKWLPRRNITSRATRLITFYKVKPYTWFEICWPSFALSDISLMTLQLLLPFNSGEFFRRRMARTQGIGWRQLGLLLTHHVSEKGSCWSSLTLMRFLETTWHTMLSDFVCGLECLSASSNSSFFLEISIS